MPLSTLPSHPRWRRLAKRLSRTALSGLVRGGATALGTFTFGWLLAWLSQHM